VTCSKTGKSNYTNMSIDFRIILKGKKPSK